MPSVFISYSSRDREAAEALQRALEQSGVGVWRDRTRLETDWSREIAGALATGTDALCLLWSEQAAQSHWVGHEWLTARALEKRIFPCLLDPAPPLPDPLRSLDAIRFADLERLVRRVGTATTFRERYDFTVIPAAVQIPFRPNPEFEGRQSDLLTLYLNLVGNLRKTGTAHVGLGGMAGVGKTQIAVEFAHRFAFAFEHIFWIQAADRDTWLRQFVEIARDRLALTVDAPAPTPRQYLLQLQAYCREHQPVLIVMDNVQDPNDLNDGRALEGLAALELGANVLFTTRRRFDLVAAGVVEQSIDILSSEAALALLAGGAALPPPERTAALDICTVVGRLPLAIVLIAAFLKKRPIGYPDYLRHLHAKGLRAIDLGTIPESQLATRHKVAVRETLAEDWQLVQSRVARQLATLLALCPESSIVPKARLDLLAGLEPSGELLDPVVEAFVELHDLRLVEDLDKGTSARLHPLVRDFVNELSTDEQRGQLQVDAATRLVDTLSDPLPLVRHVRSRGVAACLLDLKTVMPWAPRLAGAGLLHRVLDREQPHTPPDARLLQQWHHRAFSMGFRELAARFEAAALAEEHPFLRQYAVSALEDASWQLALRHGSGRVTAVAFCPDGRALTASTDKTVMLWDSPFGQPIRTLAGHTSAVRCIAACPDGRRAVSGASDGSMVLWDLERGEAIRVIKAHSASLESIAVSPDGRRALSASVDGSVTLWDLETGERVRQYLHHTGWVNSVCFAPDGTRALSGSQDKGIVLWDLESGTSIRAFDGHSDPVCGVCISPDGLLALTCSYEEALLWELDSGEIAQVLRRSPSRMRSACLVPNTALAVSGHSDNRVVLWDLNDGRAIHVLEGHSNAVSSVSASADGRLALSGSHDGSAILWSLEGRGAAAIGHGSDVNTVAFGPDGATLLSAAKDETVVLWSVESGALLRQLTMPDDESEDTPTVGRRDFAAGFRDDGRIVSGPHRNEIVIWDQIEAEASRRLAIDALLIGFSADGRYALTRVNSQQTRAECWDLSKAAVVSSFGEQATRSACFDAEGQRVLVGGEDGSVALWTVGAERPLRALPSHSEKVTSLVVTARQAVSVSSDARVVLSDLETGQAIRAMSSLDLFFDELASISVAADGSLAVTLGAHGTLVYWNLGSGEPIRWTDAVRWTRAICLTPDGATLFGGGEGGQLASWNVKSGKPRQSFRGHSDTVQSVCCTRDGRWLFSGGSDRTIRLWDVSSGQQIRSFEGHRDRVTSLGLSADGRRLLSGSWDKTMILWDTDTAEPLCTFLSASGLVEQVALSDDGRHALSIARIDGFEVWDIDSGRRMWSITRSLDGLSDATLTPDGRRAVTLSGQRTLMVWDVESKQPLEAVRSPVPLDDLCLGPGGRQALTLAGDALVLWDLESGRQVRTMRRDRADLEQACFDSSGNRALGSYKDGALVLWDLQSGLPLTQFHTTRPATALAWRGNRVALGDASGVVSLWELHNS